MATIKIHLDTRKTAKNGAYSIVLRVSHNREHRNIPTGLRAKKSEFSEKGGQYRNNPEGNAKLLEQLQLYNQRLQEIPVQKLKQLTAQQLKLTLLQSESNQEVTMYIFWQREIEHLYQTGRTGNATVYKNSLSVLEKIHNLHKPFSEFVFKDILDIERRLYERKLTVNTVGVYMRALKAICNKAIKQELVDQAWYPFYKYTIKRGKTTPRVLSLEEMKRFVKLEVSSENKFLYSSWCIGKLIFLLRGINLKDLLQAKPEDIKGDRLIYKRSKTGKMYSIKLLPEAMDILREFHPNHTVLGIFTNEQMADPKRFVYISGQKRKLINKYLKQLGEMANTQEPITTYVFRYTYSNIAKQLGFSKDIIAEALGHEYGNAVTGIYLELFDNEVLDNMHEQVCRKVFG
ncbi:phage integrase SAM-like domain-containing protein [Cecembia rubra]|uniref:phage integrase SAM-like domain-containing protein n=1 Tax=Cecembia rubra TaxID=1485585 RepID=UPI00271499C3|nr:phage integrase SAM-like domain-containing protein [Cecembia rubra]